MKRARVRNNLKISQAHGIIFVVDSSDYSRLDEAKQVLQDLLSNEKISGKPILLLANKQDNENALDEIDLVEKMQLEPLVNKRQCPTLVETCCAGQSSNNSILDPGIRKGYTWLMNFIKRNYEELNKRVVFDVERQEEDEHKARLEMIEKLRKLKEKEAKKNTDDAIELYSDYEKQNGVLKQMVTVENDLLVQNHETASATSSRTVSSDELNYIYHVKSVQVTDERPKSATQLVKEQIELGQRRRSFKANNKTAPVSLYGGKLPHSASEKRTVFANDRRNLRSAGDSMFIAGNSKFVAPNLPNAVPINLSEEGCQGDSIQMNNFKQKLPPLPGLNRAKQNGVSSVPHSNYDENAISVIEVD